MFKLLKINKMRQETLNAKRVCISYNDGLFFENFKVFVVYELRFNTVFERWTCIRVISNYCIYWNFQKWCFRLYSYKNAKRQTVYRWIQQTSLEPSGRHFVWWVWQFEVGYNTFSYTYIKQKPSSNAPVKINKPETKTSNVGDL